MLDMTTVSAIGSSLGSAATLTKAILGMKVDQEVMAKVTALQGEIMAAQSAALSSFAERAELLQKVDELERKLKIQAGWEAESQRYALTEFSTGAQAYLLRPELSADEPSHKLCPHCFQEKRKSILQSILRSRGGEVVECPSCKLRLELIKSAPRQQTHVTSYF